METQPNQTTEPEAYEFPVFLKGANTSVPTLLSSKRVTVSRTSAGVLKLSFPDDPGPVFLGGTFGFQDVTAANGLGWSVCFGAYTARSGSTPASLVFTVGNASNAATDLATTTSLKLHLEFKQAAQLL
jgi:hypothetical protein